MELNEPFPNLNAQWVQWSEYEIAEVSGVRDIRPVETAGASPLYAVTPAKIRTARQILLGRLPQPLQRQHIPQAKKRRTG
ncbi:hypothetical protein [Ethanoligenens harbinense]|uniref:hypothetical protein n=1 Tax=Ethanoligenens harbinense TaxID=253239 RepID=UPI0005A2EFE4|nr:hypothetical protein [Ethanoligenens harbinense]AVQ95877.1 hypothetical protein CXQ68_06295 [Ethanoligenens harbinense YUAN-3]AYF38539.1 hypothetical protein CXP51_06160 [Ethanoligenens harbinense]AYF41286.1 hypothetical protein CN246_06300 [Ethanoligenens harbinense]QCN92118.1 hypothetical protein DRA42_06320 [Ethanoligenens harbinense]